MHVFCWRGLGLRVVYTSSNFLFVVEQLERCLLGGVEDDSYWGLQRVEGCQLCDGREAFDNVFSTQSACGPQVYKRYCIYELRKISESQNYTQKLRSHVLASFLKINLLESLENTRGVFMVCLPCNLRGWDILGLSFVMVVQGWE